MTSKFNMLFPLLCWLLMLTCTCGKTCNFPPSMWCSSPTIARICQVEKQCSFNSQIRGVGDDRVQFALYYETMCPDCQDFVQQQLMDTFDAVGSIMDLQLVPYGNAMETQVGDHWEFTCQHGADECLGNLIQTCALHVLPIINYTARFIFCMETSGELPKISAPGCAAKYGVPYDDVKSCMNSTLGNNLQHQMAALTDKLDPPHTSVPWVTLFGVHTDDIQNRALNNLTGLICDSYQGSTKPDVCNKF